MSVQSNHGLLLERVRLGERPEVVDVLLGDGLISWVGEAGQPPPSLPNTRLDLAGHVVLPSFVEAHAHLDKALLTREDAASDGLRSAIDAFKGGLYSRMGFDDVTARATAALRIAVSRGVTHVRTHVDCAAEGDLGALRALTSLRRRLRNVIDIQVVALLLPPQTDTPTYRARLSQILAEEPDLLGGCPWLDSDPSAALDLVLSVATDAGVGLDLHLDESLDIADNALEMVARKVQNRSFPYPVTASHVVSLGQRTGTERRRVIDLVSEAGINVVTLPQTNLLLQGRDADHPIPRALPPVRELLEANAEVAAGSDNWRDPFNPLARIDPLETVSLLVSAAHLPTHDALSLVTDRARRVLGHPVHRLQVGAAADLVAQRGSSLAEALADASEQRVVIRQGRVIATTRLRTSLGPELWEGPAAIGNGDGCL